MVQQLSKSGVKDTPLLKAGHPPAVEEEEEEEEEEEARQPLSPAQIKAGGKRVAKKCLEDSGTHGTAEKESKRSDKLSRSVASSTRMQQVGLLFAGTLDKLSHDFPETPVSVRHSKVRPAVEKPHSPRSFFIQQPRKY